MTGDSPRRRPRFFGRCTRLGRHSQARVRRGTQQRQNAGTSGTRRVLV